MHNLNVRGFLSYFQSNNIEKLLSHKYLFFLKVLEEKFTFDQANNYNFVLIISEKFTKNWPKNLTLNVNITPWYRQIKTCRNSWKKTLCRLTCLWQGLCLFDSDVYTVDFQIRVALLNKIYPSQFALGLLCLDNAMRYVQSS